jgi:UDP-N-acetylmuramate dehydrogenase
MRLGGPATALAAALTTAELVELVAAADNDLQPVLLVGGGSNLVVGDEGWPGLVVQIASRGLRITGEHVVVSAGHPWDEVVSVTLATGLVGLETMSGIPGLTGATPVQNVGAYGSDISDVLVSVRVYDRQTRQTEEWPAERCRFGFRTSIFKHSDRWVVLELTLQLTRASASRPVRYLELARRLGIEPGESGDPLQVREAVLELRRSKGMVLDAADHDTWSVGSFFVNPLLPAVPPAATGCPNWPADGQLKLSAAWLIEQAGFHRGYGLDRRPATVAVSNKHTLALTNRGGASTAQLMSLAAEIRDGVRAKFGISLGPEAHLRGCSF